jgi:ribonuclease HII
LHSSAAGIWFFEEHARREGYNWIAGVDEVGRGPLAGPVVACAAVLPPGLELRGLDDSKKLSPAERERIADILFSLEEVFIGTGIVDAATIDRLNILRATHLAMRQALLDLSQHPDYALVDGRPVPELPVPSMAIVKGDGLSASIAAASIVAKVQRDRMMLEYDRIFPGYGFAKHKGYGTFMHVEALGRQGPSPIHRRSFSPVAKTRKPNLKQPVLGLDDA